MRIKFSTLELAHFLPLLCLVFAFNQHGPIGLDDMREVSDIGAVFAGNLKSLFPVNRLAAPEDALPVLFELTTIFHAPEHI